MKTIDVLRKLREELNSKYANSKVEKSALNDGMALAYKDSVILISEAISEILKEEVKQLEERA